MATKLLKKSGLLCEISPPLLKEKGEVGKLLGGKGLRVAHRSLRFTTLPPNPRCGPLQVSSKKTASSTWKKGKKEVDQPE